MRGGAAGSFSAYERPRTDEATAAPASPERQPICESMGRERGSMGGSARERETRREKTGREK
eukprot:scaffold36966_cov30-Tisochrysis_lutea.AAC.1